MSLVGKSTILIYYTFDLDAVVFDKIKKEQLQHSISMVEKNRKFDQNILAVIFYRNQLFLNY